MKTIISTTHKQKLLEDFHGLNSPTPEKYEGFVYMWRCVPEDLYYIGSHKGKASDDYRGSGRRFRQLFEYYGITKFERVILEYVADADELKVREQTWMQKFNAVTAKNFLNAKKAIVK